jgi:hypothetical protein
MPGTHLRSTAGAQTCFGRQQGEQLATRRPGQLGVVSIEPSLHRRVQRGLHLRTLVQLGFEAQGEVAVARQPRLRPGRLSERAASGRRDRRYRRPRRDGLPAAAGRCFMVRDSKITGHRNVLDQLALLRQLGAVP